ncbi:chemotaxis response regulator protein-glutamate methylesterase [Bacteroides xylanolyticus]|uniref:Protein-glutamate methylesterase/protein-glutamine glutaminase n=2 Tax=Lacrimispora defluvii TaxID=2719233 RepID=A0ABX1VZF0_9FIRM|nr:chemotaxis response regulator protein-glutamate methylesterase [Lacrimispora defluvii]NNJ32810.1 chemotaxis response regulator protein-glutamate methylesterase [Lacrimispora defluvii]
MDKTQKIKVLVVDDSLLFRETIARAISSDPQIVIAAVATNPFEARDRIVETHPDVVVCDVEMPLMNGIEFLRQLLPQYFVPVVMVSSGSNKVFEAIEAGAVDFVAKPDMQSGKSIEAFCLDLIQKIKAASTVKTARPKPEKAADRLAGKISHEAGAIIAIGASTGGTEAIFNILSALPPTVPGIVIVQHIPPVFSEMFAERLNTQTALRVKEAETGDYADQGTVLIAPGDRHMRIKKVGQRYRAECFQDEKVNGHCPSVDVLFDSVAKEAGGHAIGILLTGMGYDGAKGLLGMRRKGARTIGQDQASSVVYGMPKVAFDIGAVEFQAALTGIPQVLFNLLK